MDLFLSHTSALWFWRQGQHRTSRPHRIRCMPDIARRAISAELVASANALCLPNDSPIELLVSNKSVIRKHKRLRFHLWQSPIVPDSFYRIGKSAYVASPEFLFLQLANQLSFTELVALGNELCGHYSLRASPGESLSGIPRALSTVNKMQAFLDAAQGSRGCAKATSALGHVIEGSASPAETETEMLLCLPPMRGGYGITKPVMNKRVELGSVAQSIAHKPYCVIDLCWPEHKLGIEYYGSKYHSGRDQMQADTTRMDALIASGYHMLAITSAQLHSVPRFEAIALNVAKALDKRLVKSYKGATPERNKLRSSLFAWHHRGGIPTPPP